MMKPEEKWNNLKNEYPEEEIPIEQNEEEKIPMTEEEQQRFKKILLIFILIIMVILITIIGWFVTSILFKEKTNIPVIDIEEQEQRKSLPSGEIPLDNEIIKELNAMFDFNINNPLYEENILKLFPEGKIEIKELDFQTKMLLITSHKKFKDFMLEKTNLKNYQNKQVILTKEKLNEIAKEIFGEDINLEYENFKYFYEENEKVAYFDAILDNDKYIFTETTGTPSKIEVYMKLDYVFKTGIDIELKYKTVFINEIGIFKDKGFQTLISINKDNPEKYLSYSEIYNFNYQEIEMFNYFLNNIEVGYYVIGG